MLFTLALLGSLLAPVPAAAASGALTVRVFTGVQTASVPRGAERVPVLRAALTATCTSQVQVSSITLTDRGRSFPADIQSVYVLSGSVRITRGAPLRRQKIAEVRFSPPLVLAPCSSQELLFAVDIASGATLSAEHAFLIARPQDVASTAASVQLLGSQGGSIRLGGTLRTTVFVDSLPLLAPVSWGDDQVVARLRLRVRGPDDVALTAMTLTNDGSAANADLQKLVLVSSAGRQLSTIAAALTGRRLQLTFSPMLVLKSNEQRIVTLHASIRASRTHTIDFTVQEPGDVRTIPVGRGR